jgi:hypothetical protein
MRRMSGVASWAAAGMLVSLMSGGLALAALKPAAPKDVDLSGRWKLNAALSEDPHAAIEVARGEMREKAQKKSGRKSKRDEQLQASERFDNMADFMEEAITTPEEFAIQQESEAFVLVLPERTDTCRTKQRTEITISTGAKAQRQCGWDKRVFVIEVTPKEGPARSARYELDTANDRLVVTSELKGERIPEIQVKRVYERVAS